MQRTLKPDAMEGEVSLSSLPITRGHFVTHDTKKKREESGDYLHNSFFLFVIVCEGIL